MRSPEPDGDMQLYIAQRHIPCIYGTGVLPYSQVTILNYMAGSLYWGGVTGCILPLPPHVALIEASSKGNLPIVNQILQEGRQDVNACDRVSHMISCVHV